MDQSKNFLQNWKSVSASVSGASHLNQLNEIPCQDASIACAKSRPFAVVSDGCGSAKLSHLASKSTVQGLSKLIQASEPYLKNILDIEDVIMPSLHHYLKMLMKYVMTDLKSLMEQYKCSHQDLSHTLNLVILGKVNWLYLKIGDGAIIYQQGGQMNVIQEDKQDMPPNMTNVITTKMNWKHIKFGIKPIDDLENVMLVSDGVENAIVADNGHKFADAIQIIMDAHSNSSLQKSNLVAFLNDEQAFDGITDDKSLALISVQKKQNTESN